MQRTGALALALGYVMSFVIVCLAACFMPVAADHSCCAPEDGIGATSHDCCSVTPGITHAVPAVATAAVPSVTIAAAMALAPFSAPATQTPLVSASPPLVLRV